MDRKRWQIYFPDSKNKENEKKIGDKMAYMAERICVSSRENGIIKC